MKQQPNKQSVTSLQTHIHRHPKLIFALWLTQTAPATMFTFSEEAFFKIFLLTLTSQMFAVTAVVQTSNLQLSDTEEMIWKSVR